MEALKGVGVAMGVAIGKALLILDEDTLAIENPIDATEIEQEVQRFMVAVDTAKSEIKAIKEELQAKIGEEHAFIFDTQVLLLQDHNLYKETIAFIRANMCNAEWAFSQILTNLLRDFEALEDRYFVERGNDLKDVGKRVLRILRGSQKKDNDLSHLNSDVIVIGSEFGPSNITLFEHERILGFATDFGGHTTHTAIIARALHLPAVVGLHNVTQRVNSGDTIILDSISGKVLINPDQGTLEEYQKIKKHYQEQSDAYLKEVSEPPLSKDGIEVVLHANIELPEEIDLALKNGARSVGLYRTEFIFLACSPEFPSEDFHYETYCRIAKSLKDQPCTIRTLDLGGEKFFHETFERHREANPVMGLRAVRLCLERADIFRTQLRAILRAASKYPNIRVMFPLISGVEEWRRAKAFLLEVKDELAQEGEAVPDYLPLGMMIEVPSAAIVADHLAKEADFFSIGTNDLIQYFLAIDRSNDDVGYLYEPFHPGVIRLLANIIQAAEKEGIDVTCCGEMAASPLMACLLVSLGLRHLSMNPTSLPRIHHIVRCMNVRALADKFPLESLSATGKENRKRFIKTFRELLGEEEFQALVKWLEETSV